jgi:hypothetical protein
MRFIHEYSWLKHYTMRFSSFNPDVYTTFASLISGVFLALHASYKFSMLPQRSIASLSPPKNMKLVSCLLVPFQRVAPLLGNEECRAALPFLNFPFFVLDAPRRGQDPPSPQPPSPPPSPGPLARAASHCPTKILVGSSKNLIQAA